MVGGDQSTNEKNPEMINHLQFIVFALIIIKQTVYSNLEGIRIVNVLFRYIYCKKHFPEL